MSSVAIIYTRSVLYILPIISPFSSVILKVAVHAVPYHKDFVQALKKNPGVTNDCLYEDIRAALAPLKACITEINRFYTIKRQHSESTV